MKIYKIRKTFFKFSVQINLQVLFMDKMYVFKIRKEKKKIKKYRNNKFS